VRYLYFPDTPRVCLPVLLCAGVPFRVTAADPAFLLLLQAPLELSFAVSCRTVSDCSRIQGTSWKRRTLQIYELGGWGTRILFLGPKIAALTKVSATPDSALFPDVPPQTVRKLTVLILVDGLVRS
jgi:hypothetical protein